MPENFIQNLSQEDLLLLLRDYKKQGKIKEAIEIFDRLVNLNPKNANLRVQQAELVNTSTHAGLAECRNLYLAILDDFQEILSVKAHPHKLVIRRTAQLTKSVGPVQKSIELNQHLTENYNEAIDFFNLSEVLAEAGNITDAAKNLNTAVILDPNTYDTETNRETLEKIQKLDKKNVGRKKPLNRYPTTSELSADLEEVIQSHLLQTNLALSKPLSNNSNFFTMGSCFAKNLARSIIRKNNGSKVEFLEFSEHLNTTFANKVFVKYLLGEKLSSSLHSRIETLLDGKKINELVESIKETDVFILTLGSAWAFFDSKTDKFILPRHTSLNSRALAEDYDFRLTSVEQNTSNLRFVINSLFKINPNMDIILTLSPVPLITAFI